MKILSKPNGNAREYGRWAVNAYLGCPNRCQYCYLQTGGRCSARQRFPYWSPIEQPTFERLLEQTKE